MCLRWRGRSRHHVGEREGRRGGETEGLGESEERESKGEREEAVDISDGLYRTLGISRGGSITSRPYK